MDIEPTSIGFADFRVDLSTGSVWRGDRELSLRRRTWEVLLYLLQRPGELVSKDQMLADIWSEVVTEGSLSTSIYELRKALDDDPRAPRIIETVHRRGFRFIAAVERSAGSADAATWSDPHAAAAPLFVGRKAEFERLDAALVEAEQGRRQLIAVSGMPGIGKTSLANAFARRVEGASLSMPVWIARGHCIEQHGSEEAHMPVLEALGTLGRAADGEQLAEVLRQHAPSWLVQLPGLLRPGEAETLSRVPAAASTARMQREIAGALEVLTRDRILVLILEDLHWSDYATLDLLAVLAQRPDAARVLILAIFRPVDAIVSGHPLVGTLRRLRQRGRCEEIPLGPLDSNAIEAYCRERFSGASLAPGLVGLLESRTDGNPLFMVTLVDHLIEQGKLKKNDDGWVLESDVAAVGRDIPESLRQMIETQIDALGELERECLAAASVVGVEFTVPCVVAALANETDCEAIFGRLVKRGLLRRLEDERWPDGTRAMRCEFIHALYRQVLYEGLTTERRQQFHQRIGERLERAYGERASERAPILAAHFEHSGDHQRAVTYLWMAATAVQRRIVTGEGATYLAQAIAHFQHLPRSPEWDYLELLMRLNLGLSTLLTKGRKAPGLDENVERAEEICAGVDCDPRFVGPYFALWTLRYLSGAPRSARRWAAQLGEAAAKAPLIEWFAAANGGTELWCGNIAAAQECLEGALAHLPTDLPRVPNDTLMGLSERDAWATALGSAALSNWFAGFPDKATYRLEQALATSSNHVLPFTRCGVLTYAITLYVMRREPWSAQDFVGELSALASEHGYPYFRSVAAAPEGFSRILGGDLDGGLAQLEASQALGDENAGVGYSFLAGPIAEVCLLTMQIDRGLRTIDAAEADVHQRVDGLMAAELRRLLGELLAAAARMAAKTDVGAAFGDAEATMRQAIEIAREQGARTLELRAAVSLYHLLDELDRTEEGRSILAPVYEWFTEGLDTPDLVAAKALLD